MTMELNLKLADDDKFIIENNQYALGNGSYAVRQETQKGAIIIASDNESGTINVSSNFVLNQNGTEITIDYTKPNANFVDSAM